MELIDKAALVAEMERRKNICQGVANANENNEFTHLYYEGKAEAYSEMSEFIDTLEVKEVNEVPATVMVNKYGNRFISSWPGLKEYDDFKKGEEIKIVIPKK